MQSEHQGLATGDVAFQPASALLFSSCSASRFEHHGGLAAPALIVHENEPRLWLIVRQEEQPILDLQALFIAAFSA